MPRLALVVVALGLSLSACSRHPRSARRPARLAAALPRITHVVAPPPDPLLELFLPCGLPSNDIVELPCGFGECAVTRCDLSTGQWVTACPCISR